MIIERSKTLPCGCNVVESPEPYLKPCSLHENASGLLEACKFTLKLVEGIDSQYGNGMDYGLKAMLIDIQHRLKQAITKAEPTKRTQ